MSIGNVGGHVPGSEELSQILNGMGVGSLSPQTGAEGVKAKASVGRETKDTVSSYDGNGKGPDWGLTGAKEPKLPPPDGKQEAAWREFSTVQDMAKAVKAQDLPPITETLNVSFKSEKMIELANTHPLARFNLSTMGESEFETRLNAYFEGNGETAPPFAQSPKYREATSTVLEEYLIDTGSFLPDELTLQLEGGMDILKAITDYSTYLENINAPEKSYNTGPGIQKTVDMIEEYNVLVETSLQVLKEGAIDADSKVAISDFMKFLSEVLALVKKTLVEAQLMDTKKSQEKAAAEREVIKIRGEIQEKKLFEQMAFLKLKSSMDMFNKVMSILMPCISGVIILFSLIFLPFAPIVTLIMVSVALAMIGLQITLTETGAMEDMFDGINGLVDDVSTGIFGADNQSLGSFLVWLAIIIAAIVIATLLTVCPVVGIAIPAILGPIISWCVQYSGIGEQIGDKLAKWWDVDNDIGKAVLKGLGTMLFSITTALCLAIAALLRELIVQLVQGIVKLIFQLVVEIIKFIISLVTMIFQLIIAALQVGSTGIGAIFSAASEMVKLALQALKDLVNLIIDFMINILSVIMKICNALLDTIIQGVQTIMKEVMRILTKILDVLKEVILKLLESLLQMVITIGVKLFEQILALMKKALELIIQIVMQIIDLLQSLVKSLVEELTKMGLKSIEQVLGILSKVQAGAFKLLEAQVVRIQGEMDVVIELLGDLQRMLKESLNRAIAQTNEQGVGDFMEVINELTKLFQQLVQNYSQIGTGISRTAMV